jgi:hypothetical protein
MILKIRIDLKHSQKRMNSCLQSYGMEGRAGLERDEYCTSADHVGLRRPRSIRNSLRQGKGPC